MREARYHAWLTEPLSEEMQRAVSKLRRTEGVRHVALMPDAHLAEDVCVGTVLGTDDRLLPDAVGGDVGCGMRAVGFDVSAEALFDRDVAVAILRRLTERVPIHKARSPAALPESLSPDALSAPALAKRAEREGRHQLGTLGRGNHFLELQSDDDGRLFAMVHSGSRGLGPALRAHHKKRGRIAKTGLVYLLADSDEGRAYQRDTEWARRWARANRAAILRVLFEVLFEVLGARPDHESEIESDHNHVEREEHEGEMLYVHRKGAMHAPEGGLGIIPGSMGSESYHVRGRGHPPALASCSHGAGRAMSRSEARRRIREEQLLRETEGVWFDSRLSRRLCEEAPSAYKDVTKVMAAQRDLTRVVRRLQPVLVYKGA